jgi:hypothetical protein
MVDVDAGKSTNSNQGKPQMKRVGIGCIRHLAATLLIALSISACSKQESAGQEKPDPARAAATRQMMALVTSKLGDSGAVQYGDSVISKSGNRACLEYIAKNRSGDSGGKAYARFKKTAGAWSVETMDAPGESCNQGGFDDLDMEDSTKLEAIKIAASALQKSRNLSKEAAERLVTDANPDMDCFTTAMTLAHYLYEVAHDDYYHSLAYDYQINPANRVNVDIITNHLKKGECPEATDLAEELKK